LAILICVLRNQTQHVEEVSVQDIIVTIQDLAHLRDFGPVVNGKELI